MKNFILCTFTILLFLSPVFSQNSTSTNPIDEKFNELIDSSNSFKGYKVVDFGKMTALQKDTFEYIEDLRSEIATSNKEIQAQKQELAKLEAQLLSINTQLEAVKAEKDAITFLGMALDKATYKTLMWGIIAVLILTLSLFVYKFKKGHSTTREARKRMEETEKDFEAFRIKSLEKEQKLGRMLQDERNRQSQKVG